MAVSFGQVAEALDPQILNLILLPTEHCNFRCSYCYEDFSVGQMPRPVIDGVKALLTRRAGDLRELEISWFGGEPLLAKSVIHEISRHAAALRHQFPGLTYAANMTTNGYLLDSATAETLVSLGVTWYQISLDGPQEIHNRTRVRANGSGSFDQIWSNLLGLRAGDLPLSVQLRIHFSPDTVLLLDPLIADINREFGGDRRFSVYFKSVERLGGQGDAHTRLFSERLLEEAKEYLNGKLADPMQAATLTARGPYICYAAKPNSLMIRANGEIGKCTVALTDARNKLGVIRPDGTLSIDQGKLHVWMEGFERLDENQLACPYSQMNEKVKGPRDREDFFPVTFLPSATKRKVVPSPTG